jgi:hypothetical protein
MISSFTLTVIAGDVVAWKDLTVEQQEILATIQNEWNELPAKRRMRLKELTKQWDSLPEHKRNKM